MSVGNCELGLGLGLGLGLELELLIAHARRLSPVPTLSFAQAQRPYSRFATHPDGVYTRPMTPMRLASTMATLALLASCI